MKVWDIAYTGMFRGGDAYKKSDTFKDYKGAMLAVHRVIYRYTLFISAILQRDPVLHSICIQSYEYYNWRSQSCMSTVTSPFIRMSY